MLGHYYNNFILLKPKKTSVKPRCTNSYTGFKLGTNHHGLKTTNLEQILAKQVLLILLLKRKKEKRNENQIKMIAYCLIFINYTYMIDRIINAMYSLYKLLYCIYTLLLKYFFYSFWNMSLILTKSAFTWYKYSKLVTLWNIITV